MSKVSEKFFKQKFRVYQSIGNFRIKGYLKKVVSVVLSRIMTEFCYVITQRIFFSKNTFSRDNGMKENYYCLL